MRSRYCAERVMILPPATELCAAEGCDNKVSRVGSRCARCANERRLALQTRRRHVQQGQKTRYPAGDLPAPDAGYVLERIRQVQNDLDRFDVLRLRARASGETEVRAEQVDALFLHVRAKLTLAVQRTARWRALNDELGEVD